MHQSSGIGDTHCCLLCRMSAGDCCKSCCMLLLCRHQTSAQPSSLVQVRLLTSMQGSFTVCLTLQCCDSILLNAKAQRSAREARLA